MKKDEAEFPAPKKYDPLASANIGIEALASEAWKRGTTYGKLVAQLNEEEKQAVIEAYRKANHD